MPFMSLDKDVLYQTDTAVLPLVFSVPGIKPRALSTLDQHSTTEPWLQTLQANAIKKRD